MTEGRPLWPQDGMEYDLAMMSAEREYKDWLRDRKANRGITIYSNKKRVTVPETERTPNKI